ncbi:hypothetical protein PSACC_01864 [Paramicrosporidium saccamoebae]|uniref:Uncharacterized protein n=1 Tax=Paramicrosporidium saccamoebae TaxID=1246581 RepID=A0A2H9TKR1_9FUNG|nr:hypothetical protein PSACC_01864 [Paramicrosporidium saccamoebae]
MIQPMRDFLEVMATVLPVGVPFSLEMIEYEGQLTAAWEYKAMCMQMIWNDREGRELLSNDMAERFVQVLFLNLMGEREELQRKVFWQRSEEDDEGEEEWEGGDFINAELPGCREPAYDLLLNTIYSTLTQIYTAGDMRTDIYPLLHGQGVLHQLLLLLHSPDQRERQDVEQIFERLIWALRPQLVERPEFVMDTLRTIMGLLQGGLHDLRNEPNEITLRSAPHLLLIFFDRGTPLLSLARTTFHRMVVPLISSSGFQYYTTNYSSIMSMVLLMVKHDQDEPSQTDICAQFIRSLWQGPSRRDNHDTSRLFVAWDLLGNGLIVPSKLAALMQRLFTHYSTEASMKNAIAFLRSIRYPKFITTVITPGIIGPLAAQYTVLYELYSGLCQWYLRLQTRTKIAVAVLKAIKIWERSRECQLMISRNLRLRELRQQKLFCLPMTGKCAVALAALVIIVSINTLCWMTLIITQQTNQRTEKWQNMTAVNATKRQKLVNLMNPAAPKPTESPINHVSTESPIDRTNSSEPSLVDSTSHSQVDISRVYTYYEDPFDHRNDNYNRRLIKLWLRSWSLQGFHPRILTLSDAIKHPNYTALNAYFSRIPTVNPPHYELLCYRRWIAFQVAGGGTFVDLDLLPLMPFAFPVGLNGTALWSYLSFAPMLTHAGAVGAQHQLDFMAGWPYGWQQYNGRDHMSDMTMMRFNLSATHPGIYNRLLPHIPQLVHFSSNDHMHFRERVSKDEQRIDWTVDTVQLAWVSTHRVTILLPPGVHVRNPEKQGLFMNKKRVSDLLRFFEDRSEKDIWPTYPEATFNITCTATFPVDYGTNDVVFFVFDKFTLPRYPRAAIDNALSHEKVIPLLISDPPASQLLLEYNLAYTTEERLSFSVDDIHSGEERRGDYEALLSRFNGMVNVVRLLEKQVYDIGI